MYVKRYHDFIVLCFLMANGGWEMSRVMNCIVRFNTVSEDRISAK